MKTRELAEYLAMPWETFIDTVTEGPDVFVRLQVSGLPDFAVYGDSVTEVRERFCEALESHLAGYLATGKVIPEPVRTEVVKAGELTGSNATASVHTRQELIAA